MSFLTVSGTVVPVPDGGVEVEYTQVGDRARAWDGTLRTTVTGFRRAYRIRTAPMSSGTAEAVVAALSCTPPLAIAGDMLPFGVSAVYPELVSESFVAGGTGVRSVLDYRLHEGVLDTPLEWWRGSAGVFTSTDLTDEAASASTHVAAWQGRIGGNVVSQPSSNDRPLYAPTEMGSTLPSLLFNAQPWLYSTSSGLVAAIDGTDSAWSAIAVAEITTGTLSTRHLFSLRNTDNSKGLHAFGVAAAGTDLVWNIIRRDDGGSAVTVASSTVAVDGRNNVLTLRFNGERVKMWANGALVIDASQDVGAATFHDLTIGALDRSGNDEWSGWIAEVVYFPGTAISNDTRVAFEGLFGAYST